jgi:hypothetical protein
MDLYKDKYLKYKIKYHALRDTLTYLMESDLGTKSLTLNKNKYMALHANKYLQIGNGSLYTKLIELYPQFISKEILKDVIENIIINSSIGVQKEAIYDAIRDNNFNIFKILMKYTSNVDNDY